MSQVTITTEQVHELIEQLAAMTAAASITPEIVANIFEKMRNLNDQEREKVIAVAEAKIAEIQDIGIAADHVTLDSGATVEAEVSDLISRVYPLTVSFGSGSNMGDYEVGDQIVPTLVLDILRRGVDVRSTATVAVNSESAVVDPTTKTVTDTLMNSGTKTLRVSVTQAEQTVSLPDATFRFLNYVYGFTVDSKPGSNEDVASAIIAKQNTASARVLSSATTKGSTALAANKYYIFAVAGNIPLACRHAETNGLITGCTRGTCTVPRINHTASTTYSYIIVEKSSSSWNFKITNETV